jgi:hypothetical protein
MTTSLPHTHIRVRDLSELVAGIPYLIGFPPTNSLVLFTFRRCPALVLSATMRVDLPEPEHIPLLVTELTAVVVRNEAIAAIAVVVGDTGAEQRQLLETLRESLADNDILLTHASWVPKVADGERWRCYDDPLCTGVVPDPQASALAVAVAVAGDMTFPNREAVAAHLASDPEEALLRRKKLLEAHRVSAASPYGAPGREADLATLGHALDKAANSYDPPVLTDHELARLAHALSDTTVKDECLAITLTDEPQPADRLWTALVRSLPAPERAEPAFLLAMSAYLRGAGVLAALALRIATESNPEHELAGLLDMALQVGTPPDLLRSMLMASLAKNEENHPPSPPPDDDPPWDTTSEPPNTPPAPENPTTPLAQPTPEPPHATTPTRPETATGPNASIPTPARLTPPEPPTTPPSPTTSNTPPPQHFPNHYTPTPYLPPTSTASQGAGRHSSAIEGQAFTGAEPQPSNDAPATQTEEPRTAPGVLSQRAAAALGIPVGCGVLPSPKDPREPG